MTLQQLKYVVAAADNGSINEAAKKLFVSQSSLSNAIKDLEAEIKTTIFLRTNKGIIVSPEGTEFLGYARQVILQTELLEERYIGEGGKKQHFSISTQHYAFTANAFVDMIKEYGGEEYEFTLKETKTYDIIEDVKNMNSELGIIYLNSFNEKILRKIFRDNKLEFMELFTVKPHIFVGKNNPLTAKKLVCLKDLEDFPCLTIEQGDKNSLYFSEEIFSSPNHKKNIKVTDRAALINFMIGVNAYTIATGVMPPLLHRDDIVAIPLDVIEEISIGAIRRKGSELTDLANLYLEALKRIAEETLKQ